MFGLGPVELGLILLIVAMLFGVGKLPEVFGSIGKGVREFRKESGMGEDGKPVIEQPAQPAQLTQNYQQPATPTPTVATPTVATPTVATQAPAADQVEPKG